MYFFCVDVMNVFFKAYILLRLSDLLFGPYNRYNNYY